MSVQGNDRSLELHTPGDALLGLAKTAWSHWLVVLAALILGAAAGIGASFLVRPMYRAEVVAAYVVEQRPAGALGALAGELGGLAALAGMSGGLSQARDEVLSFLTSRELGRVFIETQKIGELLVAQRAGPAGREQAEAADWRRAYRVFDKQVRRVTPDKKTGAIRIVMEWPQRALATRWANDYVALANRELRDKALAETQARLQFLNQQLQSAQQLEVRDAVARVIESEMRLAMVASARTDFALKVIDPAVEPLVSERFKPRRGMYAALGALLAVGAALALLAIRSLR